MHATYCRLARDARRDFREVGRIGDSAGAYARESAGSSRKSKSPEYITRNDNNDTGLTIPSTPYAETSARRGLRETARRLEDG